MASAMLTLPSFALTPLPSNCAWMAEYAFSKMRGAPPMTVGLMSCRFSTILSMRPSIAVSVPVLMEMYSRKRPIRCASGSQRKCRSFS